MTRYRVITAGSRIHINVEDGLDSIVGFLASRYIKAPTQEQAEQLVKRNILVEWRQTYNRENKAGIPSMQIVHCQHVLSPFKRSKPNSGYIFYSSEEEMQEKLALEKLAGAGWFF